MQDAFDHSSGIVGNYKAYHESTNANHSQVNYHFISIAHSLTHCPLCPLARRRATKFFHFCLSLASLWTLFQFNFKPLNSASTVRRHVFLGLPRLHLPSGIQYSAIFVMDSLSFRMTWQIHLQRRCIIILPMSSLHHESRSLLTARPWAERGSCSAAGLFFFFLPRGHGPSAVLALQLVYYFFF